MGILQNSNAIGAAGSTDFYDHPIDQSIRIDPANSSHLKLNASDASNNRRYWTLSTWVKKTGLDTSGSSALNTFYTAGNEGLTNSSGTSDTILGLGFYQNHIYLNSQTTNMVNQTTVERRDSSGWMHVVISANNGAGLIYIDGTQTVSFNYDGGADTAWNGTSYYQYIGTRRVGTSDYYFDGYIAEMMMISHSTNAAVLTPTSFGEYKAGNIWVPKDISGLSNQDFYLKFENASDIGNDSSGNNRDFTAVNMGADHVVKDSPNFSS